MAEQYAIRKYDARDGKLDSKRKDIVREKVKQIPLSEYRGLLEIFIA